MAELNKKQIEQLDRIDNAVFELCKILLDDYELKWDMSIIGEVTEAVVSILSADRPVYYPGVILDKDGKEKAVDYVGGLSSEME